MVREQPPKIVVTQLQHSVVKVGAARLGQERRNHGRFRVVVSRTARKLIEAMMSQRSKTRERIDIVARLTVLLEEADQPHSFIPKATLKQRRRLRGRQS